MAVRAPGRQGGHPILRQGDYPLVPDELKLLHCEDFRDDAQHAFHLKNLVRQLREPGRPNRS
jgi:hypothetical protein